MIQRAETAQHKNRKDSNNHSQYLRISKFSLVKSFGQEIVIVPPYLCLWSECRRVEPYVEGKQRKGTNRVSRVGKRKRKEEQKKKKLELGWVARRWCRHSTGHGQINPDHVTLGVGVLAGPRNNRIARSVYQRALLRRQISRRYKRFHRSPLIYLVAPNSFLLFVSYSNKNLEIFGFFLPIKLQVTRASFDGKPGIENSIEKYEIDNNSRVQIYLFEY